MTCLERRHTPLVERPPTPVSGYRPGGPVGRMQNDLNRHLGQGLADPSPLPVRDRGAGERTIRVVSIASGPAALLAAYAGVLLLVWR